MKYKQIGTSDLQVSEICLGTMTWGYQNTEQEAFEQLDYAFANGINFIDTAELYAVPPSRETYGITEQYIGNYFKKHPEKRKDIIVATKIVGPGINYVRNGEGFTPKGIVKALEDSLSRLQMEYVDLYQLHWTQRITPRFGVRDYHEAWFKKDDGLEEVLGVLGKLVKEGKIREIGLSNEHSWGVMHCLRLHDRDSQIPRVQSVQNVYNLITRSIDNSLSEIFVRENVSLLPYSPLAGGLLSGKYERGNFPEGARFTTWGNQSMSRYINTQAANAITRYVELAQKYAISPTTMALSFVNNRAYVASNIIGATTMSQLQENIASADVQLSNTILQDIEKIHTEIPNPSS